MPIYKPSELRLFLKGLGIHPQKKLSQNFLIDGNIIRKIASSADIKTEDLVVEIGPGPGALTEALLETGCTVLAIEKDPILANSLKRLAVRFPKLEIVQADVLLCPLNEILLKKLKNPGQKAKVIANLPYHITTPIVTQLVKMHDCISEMIIMVQEEVARRFIGKPGTSDYSSLTVLLDFYSKPKYLFKVSRNCFYPSPKVDSAIVQLVLRPPLHVSNEENFFLMTRQAFQHRRKMLRSSLRELYSPSNVEQTLINLGKTMATRPEELSVQELITLFEKLNNLI